MINYILYLNKISPFEMTMSVNTSGCGFAKLQGSLKDRYFFHCQIRYDDGVVVLDTNDETRLAFVTSVDDFDMISYLEMFLEF